MVDDERTRSTLALIVEAAVAGAIDPKEAVPQLVGVARDYYEMEDFSSCVDVLVKAASIGRIEKVSPYSLFVWMVQQQMIGEVRREKKP